MQQHGKRTRSRQRPSLLGHNNRPLQQRSEPAKKKDKECWYLQTIQFQGARAKQRGLQTVTTSVPLRTGQCCMIFDYNMQDASTQRI